MKNILVISVMALGFSTGVFADEHTNTASGQQNSEEQMELDALFAELDDA